LIQTILCCGKKTKVKSEVNNQAKLKWTMYELKI